MPKLITLARKRPGVLLFSAGRGFLPHFTGELFKQRIFFFFSSRRRHTRFSRDWSSDVCSSDLEGLPAGGTVIRWTFSGGIPCVQRSRMSGSSCRSEERRVGKECRSRWAPDQ